MAKISVAIATFNEEKNIEDCLKSVVGWVDEIVIVDGGSTDKTVEIAQKFKAKVTVTTNPPIFHINKQKAIDACHGDWILQLDADERVTVELKKEIIQTTNQQLINNQSTTNNQVNGYWLPRSNYFLGRFLKKGGQYPDYTLRLYCRGKGKLPCKSVHEQAVVEGRVGFLKNDLLHIADPNFSRYLLRFDRYTSLIADELVGAKLKIGFVNGLNYFIIKPVFWFLITYFRHKGFVDGFPGLVFCLFSALRFPVAYIRYWEKKNTSEQ